MVSQLLKLKVVITGCVRAKDEYYLTEFAYDFVGEHFFKCLFKTISKDDI